MSKSDRLETLTVPQVRRDPVVARAMDLAVQEARKGGQPLAATRVSATTVLRLIAWAKTRLGGAIHADPPELPLAAAMHQLLALLGEDVVELWEGQSRALREAVLAQVRADVVRRARGGAA